MASSRPESCAARFRSPGFRRLGIQIGLELALPGHVPDQVGRIPLQAAGFGPILVEDVHHVGVRGDAASIIRLVGVGHDPGGSLPGTEGPASGKVHRHQPDPVLTAASARAEMKLAGSLGEFADGGQPRLGASDQDGIEAAAHQRSRLIPQRALREPAPDRVDLAQAPLLGVGDESHQLVQLTRSELVGPDPFPARGQVFDRLDHSEIVVGLDPPAGALVRIEEEVEERPVEEAPGAVQGLGHENGFRSPLGIGEIQEADAQSFTLGVRGQGEDLRRFGSGQTGRQRVFQALQSALQSDPGRDVNRILVGKVSVEAGEMEVKVPAEASNPGPAESRLEARGVHFSSDGLHHGSRNLRRGPAAQIDGNNSDIGLFGDGIPRFHVAHDSQAIVKTITPYRRPDLLEGHHSGRSANSHSDGAIVPLSTEKNVAGRRSRLHMANPRRRD